MTLRARNKSCITRKREEETNREEIKHQMCLFFKKGIQVKIDAFKIKN